MYLPYALLAVALGAGEIPLTLSNPAGIDARGWPVTIGLPFPPDALADLGQLQLLDSAGQPVPHQAEVTSRWWHRGGGIQSLALSFVADTAQPTYRLRYGQPAAAAQPRQPVTVTESNTGLVVDNGVLRATFDRGKPGLFAALAVDADGDGAYGAAEQVIGGERPAALVMGELSSLRGPVESIELESAGPVRTIVRLRGKHGDGATAAIGYDVRLHFYAGLPYVRIEHTFVQDTVEIFYDVPLVALDLPLADGAAEVRVGTRSGDPLTLTSPTVTALQVGPGTDEQVVTLGEAFKRLPVKLVRQDDGTYQYEVPPESVPRFLEILNERLPYATEEEKRMWADGTRFREFAATVNEALMPDDKLAGWVQIAPAERPWVASVGIRHFWQQHPKSLVWRNGTLRLGLYPGDLIDEPLHFHSGTAKTHTIDLWLTPAAAREQAAAAVAGVSEGPLYFASPDWYCASGVWGNLQPRREGRFPLFEGNIANEIERFMTPLQDNPSLPPGYGGEFGMMGYGDYGGGQNSLNLETAMDHGFAVQFLRTADRRVFDRLDLAVRHFRDIDIRNAVPDGQAFDYGLWLIPGYMPEAFAKQCAEDEALRNATLFYQGEHPPQQGGVYRHGFRHYGMDQRTPYPPYSSRTEAHYQMYAGHCNVSGHGWAEGLIDHFLLTGDRRSLEVAERVGDFVLNHAGTNWGRDNWKYRDLARLYRVTGNEAYLTRLREALDSIYSEREVIVRKVAEQDKTLMSPYYTILQFIAEMHRITGDETIAKQYLELLDAWLELVPEKESGIGPVFAYLRDYRDSRCHTDFADLAYAYQLTGDRNYLERSVRSADFYNHFAFHSTGWFSMPEYLYALDQAGIEAFADPPRQEQLKTGYVVEEADRPFEVVVVQEQGYRVAAAPTSGALKVFAPSGKLVLEQPVTMGGTDVFRLSVPADGEHGSYRVEAKVDNCWHWFSSDLPLSRSPLPMPAEGKVGQGVELSRLARLVVPSEGALNLAEGTIEFWVKPLWDSPAKRTEEVPYHYNHIFDSRDGEYDHGLTVHTWDGGTVGARKSLIVSVSAKDAADNISVPLTWTAGEWHHVAFAWRKEGGLLRLYVDGELAGSKDGAVHFPERINETFTLGSNTPANENAAANVVLDEVRLWPTMREPAPDGADGAALVLDFEDAAKVRAMAGK